MFIEDYLKDSIRLQDAILKDSAFLLKIEEIAEVSALALSNGNKIMLIGNGGSAADSQHLAAEFVCKLSKDRKALPAIALTTDSSVLTSISNDYGFEYVFSRQVEALGKDGDVLIAVSTSGNSLNVVNALKTAVSNGIKTVGFCGQNISKMDDFCDYSLKVPTSDTQKIQEIHIILGHIICSLVEQKLFN